MKASSQKGSVFFKITSASPCRHQHEFPSRLMTHCLYSSLRIRSREPNKEDDNITESCVFFFFFFALVWFDYLLSLSNGRDNNEMLTCFLVNLTTTFQPFFEKKKQEIENPRYYKLTALTFSIYSNNVV